MNHLFLADQPEKLKDCYTQAQRGDSPLVSSQDFFKDPSPYVDTEYLFSTWGMPTFTEAEILKFLPQLKAVFFAGGSVKYFADPFIFCGVRVFSGWQANALAVAEFLVGQILLANKGYFQLHSRYEQEGFQAASHYCQQFSGNHRAKVGFLGYGAVTQATLRLLCPFSFDIYLYSNDITPQQAEAQGISLAPMADVFRKCQVISNNMASIPKNIRKINHQVLSQMGDYSTFLNIGRGSQVNMPDLIQVLQEKPTCTALLDVTDPEEPLPPGHPLFQLPNVAITPHIAGSVGQELFRLGEYLFQDYEALLEGGPVYHEVTKDMPRY